MAPKNLILALLLAVSAAAQTPQRAIVADPTTGAPIWPTAGTLRLQLGGIRSGLTDGASVLAATPDYEGQWLTALDGYVGLSDGAGAGDVLPFAVVTDGNIYFLQNTSLSSASLTVDRKLQAGDGTSNYEHVFMNNGGDNVGRVRNAHADWYSALSYETSDGLIVGALGVANPNSNADLRNKLFLQGNTQVGGDSRFLTIPPIVQLGQDFTYGADSFRSRAFVQVKAGNGGKIGTAILGQAAAAAEGGIGLWVNEDDRVGVGTDTLTAGAALTVDGSVKSTQQAWSVHKNGTDQTISAATWTAVTFGTEGYDQGGIFASNAATPTIAGLAHMQASVYFSSTTDGERLLVAIAKNGTRVAEVERIASTSAQESVVIARSEVTDGDDAFAVHVYRSSGTSVSGGAVYTYFQGWVQ